MPGSGRASKQDCKHELMHGPPLLYVPANLRRSSASQTYCTGGSMSMFVCKLVQLRFESCLLCCRWKPHHTSCFTLCGASAKYRCMTQPKQQRRDVTGPSFGRCNLSHFDGKAASKAVDTRKNMRCCQCHLHIPYSFCLIATTDRCAGS